MPLTATSLNASLNFTLQNQNNVTFGTPQVGPTTEQFLLNALSLSAWNNMFAVQSNVSSASTWDFNLSAFTNVVNESVSLNPGHALYVVVFPTLATTASGANCLLSPGGSNPIQAWFANTSTASTISIPINGMFLMSNPGTGSAGYAVTSTAGTFRIANTGTSTLTATVLSLVGP